MSLPGPSTVIRKLCLVFIAFLTFACGNAMKFIDETSQKEKNNKRIPGQTEINDFGTKGQVSNVNESESDVIGDAQNRPAHSGDGEESSGSQVVTGGANPSETRSEPGSELGGADAISADKTDGQSLADPTENLEVSEEPFQSDLCQRSHGMTEKVIKLTRGLVDFENGTSAQIIHLVVAGNGEFRMSSESLNGVKAVCIDSRGNSALTVNLGQNVDILEYRGVGNGQAFIKLAEKEKSRMITGSLTGNHKLTMEAGSEACAMADFDLKGHSAMTCR